MCVVTAPDAHTQREKDRQTETKRQRDRETERQRQTDRERDGANMRRK